MQTKRTLLPGQPGTKKYIEKYGKDLVCVRYKYDKNKGRRYTTIELIIDQSPVKPGKHKISGNKIMPLKVGYEETYIRKLVKQAGGRWNKEKKVWELPYRDVVELGLKNRLIVTKESNIS